MFRFASWYFLFLIPLVPLIFVGLKKRGSIPFSSVVRLKEKQNINKIKVIAGRTLIGLGIISLIVGLARPQIVNDMNRVEKNGIDIIISLDVSQSMKARNMGTEWIAIAKNVAVNFVDKRMDDRIGLVIFSGTAYTKIPLTVDHDILKNVIKQVQPEDVNKDGTAIGTGMAVALSRLKNSTAKTKIVIMITDGDNNTGSVTPETAIQLAKDMGVKIYTIGVGNDTPTNTVYGQVYNGLNEGLLKQISSETGGFYFRAKSAENLKAVFDKIDKNEKTKINALRHYNFTELYHHFALIGLMLILIGLIIDEIIFVRIP